MKAQDLNLERMIEFRPEAGRVMLGNDRMLIFRQQAMSTLRKLMYEHLGDNFARALLSQFGFECGAGDYANMIETYTWDEDIDKLASGPVLHSWEGIVRATPTMIDYDRASGRFDMAGEWHDSYEAEIHLQLLGPSELPVCHSLSGYASGWGSRFFGQSVTCIERSCVARGDDLCRFELRDSDRWGPEADPWKQALTSDQVSLAKQLEQQLGSVREQHEAAIVELSTPIMEIWDQVLVMPIVGALDQARSVQVMSKLLEAISRGQARCVIIDLTGVEFVDTQTANHLLQMIQAAGLLGTYCVITGVGPQVAQTLVALGVDMSGVSTLRDLKAGLRACLRWLG